MTPVADNPVLVPSREPDQATQPGESEPPRIRCPRFVVGRRAKTTNGSALAASNGTRYWGAVPLVAALSLVRAVIFSTKMRSNSDVVHTPR